MRAPRLVGDAAPAVAADQAAGVPLAPQRSHVGGRPQHAAPQPANLPAAPAACISTCTRTCSALLKSNTALGTPPGCDTMGIKADA